jgi:hypothetical protein
MSVNSKERPWSAAAQRWALPRWMLFVGVAIVFSGSLVIRYLREHRPASPDPIHHEVIAWKLSGTLVYVSAWDIVAVMALMVVGLSVAFLACRK